MNDKENWEILIFFIKKPVVRFYLFIRVLFGFLFIYLAKKYISSFKILFWFGLFFLIN